MGIGPIQLRSVAAQVRSSIDLRPARLPVDTRASLTGVMTDGLCGSNVSIHQ